MSPSVAVLTPGPGRNLSPLLPSDKAEGRTDWEWYHRCLSLVGEVRYFDLTQADRVSGFDAVLVHEGIEAAAGTWTMSLLSQIRGANAKLIWVEPHGRTTFGAPVFEPDFFDVVDQIVKYQLMDYASLIDGLRSPASDLGPWALLGHSSIADFYANPALFALPTTSETIALHLEHDLSDRYGERITPMMRMFTFPGPSSWYGNYPSRQPGILHEAEVGIAQGDAGSSTVRGVIAGLLGQCGLGVKLERSRVRAAATSRAYVAVGPVHLDNGAADVLRFDTLAILPEDPRYRIWNDVFVPYQSYLPLAGVGDLMRQGGRVIDAAVARGSAAQLAADLADPALRERILAGQRRAHERLTDPSFVAAKLGVQATPTSPAAVGPQPRPATFGAAPAAPVQVGAIRSDEISVVIQGALGGLTEHVIESVRRQLPGAEVIVSTWEGERALNVAVDRRIESVDPGAPWQVHEEWPANTNRLLVSTVAGLHACERPYTLKLRGDTPLSGHGFLEAFQSYPERTDSLRLLRDRLVVINYYCWNPERSPFGLFAVADTVQFGRTEDLRSVWDRPLDAEPQTSTWFVTHTRPQADQRLWPAFRYSPEQLLWLGFLRQHIEVPFEHFCDDTAIARLLAQLSYANNLVIVEPERFGVELPTFAGRKTLEPDELYSLAMWETLYERFCVSTPNPAVDAVAAAVALSEHRAPGADPERLDELAERLDDLAERALAESVHPLQGARDFVVLVDAEELLAAEELLRAYADGMRGSRTATLAIDASRLPDTTAAAQLRELVIRCELAGGDDVDLLAVIGQRDAALQRPVMIRGARALYSRQPQDDSVLPVFTPASIGELRALAETSASQ